MINPGDNNVFLDLMYATWDEGERHELDRLMAENDPGLSRERLDEIGAYSMRDPGDEDDGERRRALVELQRKHGHTLKHRPRWLPEEED